MRYKANNGFVKRTIAGESLLVPVGAMTQTFNGMVMLNTTGDYLWELLAEERSLEELITEMKKEFEASEEEISADVHEFLENGINEGLIQVV